MKKVLLTGFGPFGDDKINPALEVIKEFTNQKEETSTITYAIYVKELPVIFGEAIEVFKEAVIEIEPDLVLSIGQAGGSMGISLERIGINLNDARIADNKGKTPQDEKIEENGVDAYFTTIDIRTTFNALKAEGIPVIISNSAGTYVCNNLIYGALHFLSTSENFTKIKYGFIHIPYLPKQVSEKKKILPSMSLNLMKKAIKKIIEVNLIKKP